MDKFLENESFREWVKNPHPDTNAYWQQYWHDHPTEQQAMAQAKLLVLHWEKQQQQSIQNDWQALKTRLHGGNVRPILWQRYTAAASVLLILGLGAWWWNKPADLQTFATNFNQTKTLLLPDSTEVTLNANSQLQISPDWQEGTPREVWLSGEGYFKVKKKSNKATFVVHTSKLDVKVLGTVFDLVSRPSQHQVMLEEGKVAVSTPTEQLLMQPNELVVWQKNGLQKITVSAQEHTAWLRNQLVFRAVPLIEVAQKLEELYGLSVEVSPEIRQKQFTAILPANDPEVVLEALKTTFGLKMTKNQKKIQLK
jgi:transmembrane sensor